MPFFVWRISGSRAPVRFFVDDGAVMMLASTIVPVLQPLPERGQVRVDLLQQRLAQTVLLQQVAEVQDRRLVGQRSRQPQPDEAPHRLHLVEQVLHAGVAQVVEQLHAVHAQHHRERVWPPTATGLRIERLDARRQQAPTGSARPSSRGIPRAASAASSSRAPTPQRSPVPSNAHHLVTNYVNHDRSNLFGPSLSFRTRPLGQRKRDRRGHVCDLADDPPTNGPDAT